LHSFSVQIADSVSVIAMDLNTLFQVVAEKAHLIRQVLFYSGLALVAGALLSIIHARWTRKPLKRRQRVSLLLLLIVGALLSFSTQFGLYRLPAGGFTIMRRAEPVEAEEQVDQAALDQLKTARFHGKESALGGKGSWPQWLGPTRDGISPETGLLPNWHKQLPIIMWKRPIGRGYSSPSINEGRLYLMDSDATSKKERVLCRDADSGKEIWVYAYDVSYKGQGGYPGPRATPAIFAGRVYAVGYNGQLLCLDANAKSGESRLLWKHDLLEEFHANLPGWGVACSPLIESNLVIVQPGGPDASIVALDRMTGSLIWKALSDPSGYSSPVATTACGIRQVICFTGKGATGVRASDGTQLWYYSWPTQYDANIATPVVAGDYVFLSSDYGSGCALLHLAGRWSGVQAEPVYVKRNKLMRNHHMTCVFRDGYLYGCDSGRGELKCIDLRTGQEKWASQIGKHSLIYADGHLIALTESGDLVLVEATPGAFLEKGRMKSLLQGPECWALPALAGGRLFVRDHSQLVCLDLRATATVDVPKTASWPEALSVADLSVNEVKTNILTQPR
jgi:outer membrane protein assembly factor BamB